MLDQLLDAARAGESRALVVRGEAGVGKSALLDYLVEQASGCRVAHAAGVESEMEPDRFLVGLAALSLLSDAAAEGGFNWSSQHLEHGGVDGTTTGLGCSGDGEAADAVAWAAAGSV